ncbi:MAG TPA: hypothetical protein V6C52_05630 [Coleofasciculaceae cyanobacterium]|jgi:hypothetical protein
MGIGGILGGGLGGLFGGGGDKKAGGNGQDDGEKKISFRQVYAEAMPGYLKGRGQEGVYTGDETTQRYYKQLKALNQSEANSCTVLSYDA